MLSDDQSEWALPDRVASLRFVMAGALAEEQLLEHPIEGGWDADLKAWRRGIRRTDAMTVDELKELLGAPFEDVLRDARSWAQDNEERVSRLAEHLATLEAPAAMPYDEVVAFLEEPAAAVPIDNAEGQ